MLIAEKTRLPSRVGRFAWLMGLYAENHQRLTRMFAPVALAPGAYVSRVGDGLDLRLEVLERHPYTLEMRLSYAMPDPVTGAPDPSAHVRHYLDARQTEATHCYVGRRWQDVIGLDAPSRVVFDHRLRMNTFLGKWLQYLAEQGHGAYTLRSAEPADPLLAAV
ncbi:DUF1249 domain-containing protein [Coralloluteibacterium thermophilus]|uniref:DUF1249 domain-containing protein n=1 Tax=Coralloluteibacterium thermophilum TaxID=2707049 RepID=A0ABV9NLM3_9GAMM